MSKENIVMENENESTASSLNRGLLEEKFRAAGSNDIAVASKAQQEIAQAVELPLRKTLLSADNIAGIFEYTDFSRNQLIQYPLDLITPGQEAEFYAYVMPANGMIPMRKVEGDYLSVPTYNIGNSIDCNLRLIKDANWPVITRMMEILEAGFIKKMNDDAWQTLMTAAFDRNVIVADANAASGNFTPRLVSLLKTVMGRNSGGNVSTSGRTRLTDLYVSPEALDDIRSWGVDLIPDGIREKIYNSGMNSDDSINIYGVNIHPLYELGEGQEYQLYYQNVLGGTMVGDDVEIVIGLDRNSGSFVMPVDDPLKIWEDNTLHRQGLFGMYGRMGLGFAVLDSRDIILGSI